MTSWHGLRRLGLALVVTLSLSFVCVACGDNGGAEKKGGILSPITNLFSGDEKKEEKPAPAMEEESMAKEDTPRRDPRTDDLEAIQEEIRRLRMGGDSLVEPRDTSTKMADADERLKQYAGDLSLEAQHKRVVSLGLYRDGLAAENNGDVTKALELYKGAWETDPTNVEAEKKYWEMMAVINQDRYGDLRTDWERMSDTRAAQVELIRLQLQNDYDDGVKFYNQGKYDDAIKKFNSVFDRIEFSPLEIDVQNYRDNAAEYLKRAKAGKLIQDAEEKKRVQEEALSLAEGKEAERDAVKRANVQKWLMEARNAFAMEKYETVGQKCKLILQNDPNNVEAKKLLQNAEEASLDYVSEKIRRQQIRAWQNQMLDFQEILTPWWDPDNVVFPEIRANEPVNETGLGIYLGGEGGGGVGGDAARRILAETHIQNLDFQQRSLIDLVSLLQDRTGLNMVMDNDYADIATAPVINLKVRDVSAARVFSILNDMYGVDYDVLEQGDNSNSRPTLFVTHASRTGGQREIFRHYIADILNPATDYPATDILFGNKANPSFAEEVEIDTEAVEVNDREQRAKELVKLIKAAVEPHSWDQKDQYGETPVVTVTDDGYLMVKHTRRVQQAVAGMVGDMRRVNGIMVSIETAFITITDDTLNRLVSELGFDDTRDGNVVAGNTGGTNNNGDENRDAGAFFHELNPERRVGTRNDADLTSNGGFQGNFQFLDDFEVAYTFQAVKKDSRTKAVTAPRLTLFNSQRANVARVNSRSYIQDYDVQVATGTSIFDPVIGHVDSGVVLDVRPTVSHDLRYIDLELHTTLSDIAPNMRTLPAAVGGPNSPVIELPELDVQSISSTMRIPDGGTLMIGGNRSITDANNELNVPFIEKIPVLNFFFGSKQRQLFQASTVILVRAKVIVLDEALEHQLGEQ